MTSMPSHILLLSVQARAAAKVAAKASAAPVASEGQKSSKKAEQEAKRVGGCGVNSVSFHRGLAFAWKSMQQLLKLSCMMPSFSQL